MSWIPKISRTPRPYSEAARLIFEKVQSGQSPLMVALGWEPEMKNNYWSCDGKLYDKRGNDFIFIPTTSLNEAMEEWRKSGKSRD